MRENHRYTISVGFWIACAAACLLCAALCLYRSWLDYTNSLPWATGQMVRYFAAFLLPCAAILSARRVETLGRRRRGLELRRTSIWDAMMNLYAALVFLFNAYMYYVRGLRRGGVSWGDVIGALFCAGIWICAVVRDIWRIKQSKTVPIQGQSTDN